MNKLEIDSSLLISSTVLNYIDNEPLVGKFNTLAGFKELNNNIGPPIRSIMTTIRVMPMAHFSILGTTLPNGCAI